MARETKANKGITMRIAVSIIFFLLSSSNLVAAEISLLVQYKCFVSYGHDGYDSVVPLLDPLPPQPTPHKLGIGAPGIFTSIEIPVMPENFGKTFGVDSATLAGLNKGLTGPTPGGVVFAVQFGHSLPVPYHGYLVPPYYFEADIAFRGDRSRREVHSEAFVPQLGPEFSGYIIDDLTVSVGNSMLIQIYGHAVPEPTFLMTLLSCTALVPFARMRRTWHSVK